MSLTSVLGIVAVCVVLRCEARPKIGQMANTDPWCKQRAGESTPCTRPGKFTCAKLDGEYVTSETMCDFCSTYGDTEAIVYHEGEEQRCAELEHGYPISDDPECTAMRDSQRTCSEYGPHICASLQFSTDDYSVSAKNKCKFCKLFGGNSHYIYYGEGKKCAEINSYVRILFKGLGLLR